MTGRSAASSPLCGRQGAWAPGAYTVPWGASPMGATMEAGITRSHSEPGS